MRQRTAISEMPREEVRRRAPGATAVVPIGATEQHGYHLPLGTDAYIVSHVASGAVEIAAERADMMLAPTIPIGFSRHHLQIGPTITFTVDTTLTVLYEVCSSLADAGFQRIFILNGHGGNAEIITLAARNVGLDFGITVGAGSYWALAWDELVAVGVHPGGHGGIFETSLMMAIRGDLVSEPPSRPGAVDAAFNGERARYHTESPDTWTSIDGYSGDPSQASVELGKTCMEIIVQAAARDIGAFADS